MNSDELKKRTKAFALSIIKLVDAFPRTKAAEVVERQLVKAATSVGANYRAACRAQSHAHFVSKISVVEEEADECVYWLELALDAGMVSPDKISSLLSEAKELTAIFTASRHTAKRRN
jgi:four helix bundle protein